MGNGTGTVECSVANLRQEDFHLNLHPRRRRSASTDDQHENSAAKLA